MADAVVTAAAVGTPENGPPVTQEDIAMADALATAAALDALKEQRMYGAEEVYPVSVSEGSEPTLNEQLHTELMVKTAASAQGRPESSSRH